MSTSRRSSHSIRSTATTRSARPATWRAASISKSSTGKTIGAAPLASPSIGVSLVIAEPETASPTETQWRSTRRTRLLSSSSAVDSLRDQGIAAGVAHGSREASTTTNTKSRTRLQDMFDNEVVNDVLGEGGSSNTSNPSAMPETTITDATVDPDCTPSSDPISNDVASSSNVPFPSGGSSPDPSSSSTALQTPLSTSPGRMTWFASLGRSRGKEKAAQMHESSKDDTLPSIEPASREPAAVPSSLPQTNAVVESKYIEPTIADAEQASPESVVDSEVQSPEALASAIDALGVEDTSKTIRAAPPPSQVQPPTPPQDIPNTSTQSASTSDTSHHKPPPVRHTWFNAFAPRRPTSPPSVSASPRAGTSPTSPSPLSGNVSSASSSFPSSIDDEVPQLVKTPAGSDDEDGGKMIFRVQEPGAGDGARLDVKEPISTGEGGPGVASPSSSPSTGTIRPRTRLDSLSSLNPSASRFSISIPLLGRPKMRLEDAVKREQEEKEVPNQDGNSKRKEDVKDATSAPATESLPQPDTSLSQEITLPSSSVSDQVAKVNTSAPLTLEPSTSEDTITPSELTATYSTSAPAPTIDSKAAEQREGLTTAQPADTINPTNPAAYTWWDYVPLGWPSTSTSAKEMTASSTPVDDRDGGKTMNSEVGDTTAEATISGLPAASQDEPQGDIPDGLPTPAVATVTPGPTATLKAATPTNNVKDRPKASSLFSAETAQSGSWLSPWSWYGYGTGTGRGPSTLAATGGTGSNGTDGQGAGVGSGPGSSGDEDGVESGKELTESEKIKEEALARDREREEDSSKDSTEPSCVVPEQETVDASSTASNVVSVSAPGFSERNPISDSASSLRSGWASFFSLSGRGRDLMMKSLEEGNRRVSGESKGEDEVRRDENGMEIMDLEEEEHGDTQGQVPREEDTAAVKDKESKSEVTEDKQVTKQSSSTALALMRALALAGQQNTRRIKAKEEDDKKVEVKDSKEDLKEDSKDVRSSSPNPSTKGETGEKSTPPSPSAVKGDFSVSGSPTKSFKDNVWKGRSGRTSSISTTKSVNISNVASNGKPPPPLTVSDSVKASVVANKRSGVSPAPSSRSKPSDGAGSGQEDSKNANSKATKAKSKSASGSSTPAPPPAVPNLVLPTWADTFHTAPRNYVPEAYLPAGDQGAGGLGSTLGRTMRYVSGVLLGSDTSAGAVREGGAGAGAMKRRARRGSLRRRSFSSGGSTMPGGAGAGVGSEILKREREREDISQFGHALPRSWDVLEAAVASREAAGGGKKGKGKERAAAVDGSGMGHVKDVLRGCKKVVVIGIHGWFPGAVMRSVLGEPTGTSLKFVNMMVQAIEGFQEEHGVKLDKITKIPLEGEGTINKRVERLYANLLSNQSWMDDLHDADVIFVATHSQGSVVSTHLLDRLIRDSHIRTAKNGASEGLADMGVNMIPMLPQRVCCLALCGIHLGPLRYLSSSSLLQPYIQYFETTAARELFEFQNTESEVSKAYVKALRNVVHHGTKMVYVASLNDQVVPIYSGLFTSASHPLILRALYIDGDAYNSSDFLSKLLVLLLRVLNCGLSDSGLLAHLSEVTAGSLNGVGHSTAYEELATFSLAVNYLFLSNDGFEDHPDLQLEPFNASTEMNDYEIPWALRDLIADERVAHFFSQEITQLRDAFREWQPKTTILRDIKRKLQPIQKLPSMTTPGSANSASKL